MKASELRIGNYYKYLHEEHETIHQVTPEFIAIQLIHDTNSEDEIFCRGWWNRAIPLTEEWLLKFGFKPFVKDFGKKGVIVHTRKRGFIIRKSIPQMKYVHQLQNLYFALTGNELQLNEK